VVWKNACKDGSGVILTQEGFSGVLTQGGHVNCYESRKLKEHEVNYAKHGLELAAIVYALK